MSRHDDALRAGAKAKANTDALRRVARNAPTSLPDERVESAPTAPTRHHPWPGPWIDSPKAVDAVIAPNGPEGHGEESYGGPLVCESTCSGNKSLIKAAPRLLSVLRRMYENFDAAIHGARPPHAQIPLGVEAREAIAEATEGGAR